LIEYFVGKERRTQLFDLKMDPWEMKNLADSPDRAADLAKLRQRLTEWQKKLDDPMLK
jgi:arylsulfatase A-like enzyme